MVERKCLVIKDYKMTKSGRFACEMAQKERKDVFFTLATTTTATVLLSD